MKNIKNNKGQALVEFAIILPILLLLIMGIAEFGMMLNSYMTIQNEAREGARLGIIGGSDVEINTLIISTSPSLTAANISITISPAENVRKSGDTLTVKVVYSYHTTVPIIGALLNNVVVLSAQSSMRVE